MTPAVFLDKDGTLLDDVPHNVDPARMRFAPGVPQGLALLAATGWPLIVITNQPGVALGLFEEADLARVRRRLARMFARAGARLAGFYHCPHLPDALRPGYALRCFCRKPEPGLLRRAACEQGLALERSWFIGDILNDVEAGRRAGCSTILVDNGNETEWVPGPLRTPHHTVQDFAQAAHIVARCAAPEAA
ncbi:HAD-IIIA family hydrolase [Pigmentiphaga soli]|uniref:D,D-heptose 1,7-bisphosphate phosphatase n=1 Tax=Pigmentiphaga soli TaxID=1007095 RepID=A0ABP8GG71_9BURK